MKTKRIEDSWREESAYIPPDPVLTKDEVVKALREELTEAQARIDVALKLVSRLT